LQKAPHPPKNALESKKVIKTGMTLSSQPCKPLKRLELNFDRLRPSNYYCAELLLR
jgi:hypothetical protein